MAISVTELFSKVEDFVANHEDASKMKVTFLFRVDPAGSWYFNPLKGEASHFSKETPSEKLPDADVTIWVDEDDLKRVIDDPQYGMSLYFNGGLQINGHPSSVTKLQELFSMAL